MREHKKSTSQTSPRSATRFPSWLWYSAGALLVLVAAIFFLRERQQAVDPHSAHTSAKSESKDPASTSQVSINPATQPGPPPEGMVWIPGGTFWMGCSNCEMPDTQPIHLVSVDGFWIDTTPVTNSQFARFVEATGYATIAERQPNPKDYPGVDPKSVVPGSAVFTPVSQDVPLDDYTRWWHYVAGASWKHPEGPGSNIDGRDNHPVVQIAWEDATAYAKWSGKRLPTEAEFEFGARGGLDRNRYAWGDELKPGGKWSANIWQGRFPVSNTGEDGFQRTSPVDAFPPNGFGLFDVGGNVWQWCADWYRPDYFETLAAGGLARNPQGPSDSFDPEEPGALKRVQKGGSFLCSDRYCSRYLVGSRGRGAIDSGGSNTGFRCVK